jgi:hypothetical protein
MRGPSRLIAFGLLFLASVALVGCAGAAPPREDVLADAFPGGAELQSWETSEALTFYDSENLYDLVNGQADAFFAYRFERVVARSYTYVDGAVLQILVWKLDQPEDAYGLFTANSSGVPVAVGNEGEHDPGRRLAFWQDRYYVQLTSLQDLPAELLVDVAGAIADRLPAGGERPALVGRMPEEGRVPGSVRFFHQEISIQTEVWLGGQNVLGLSADTDGVLARYEDEGGSAGHLLVIEYPDAEGASAALAQLRAGAVETVQGAEACDALLGVVIGALNRDVARTLLAEALR